MKNNKTLWIVVAVILILSLSTGFNLFGITSLFSVGTSPDIAVGKPCSDALPIYTRGATEGQCFEYCLSNVCEVKYLAHVWETTNSAGAVTCKIDWTQITSTSVCQDNKVFAKDGIRGFCRSNADCPGTICAGYICTDRPAPSVCNSGDKRCSVGFTDKYQNCLSNGQWSGSLSCVQGLVCKNGDCVNPCVPSWQCDNWGICGSNSQQTRVCRDINSCGVSTNKPVETQGCTYVCPTNWQCSSWSACSQSGTQTRTCTDNNACGTTTDKPITSQSCTPTCTPNWVTGTWSACVSNQQLRTVTDSNNCGILTNKPTETQTCVYPTCVTRQEVINKAQQWFNNQATWNELIALANQWVSCA